MKKYLLFIALLFFFVLTTAGITHGATDPCGNTGGIGHIVTLENNSFILLRKDGQNLKVNLNKDTKIETSSGEKDPSVLVIGNPVTLVGDDNRDGTFNAEAVVVCSVDKETVSTEANTSPRTYPTEEYEKISQGVELGIVLIVFLSWLVLCLFLRTKLKKSIVYLLFFTIFYIYLYKVLDYTLLQFQTLIILKHFVPNLMLNGVPSGRAMNLIPLASLTQEDIKTSALNVLMMVPFGFGLPFVSHFRMKKVVLIAFLVSIIIELLQFITGFMANTTFRVADINDIIFNTIGSALGYIFFTQFMMIYKRVHHESETPKHAILRHIHERPQIDR